MFKPLVPVDINRKFGVEIECVTNLTQSVLAKQLTELTGLIVKSEETNHHSREYWKVVGDGSLHNQGWELVSPPMKGEDGFQQILKICEGLQELGCTINYKCGLHVHIDASDLTGADITSLIRQYFLFESRIDGLVSFNRRKNDNAYCASMKGIYNILKLNNIDSRNPETHKDFLNLDIKELINQSRVGNNRFYKINLLSYIRHGTIEFRQHNGTINGEKICHWTNFLLNFVEKTKMIEKEFPKFEIQTKEVEVREEVLNPLWDEEKQNRRFDNCYEWRGSMKLYCMEVIKIINQCKSEETALNRSQIAKNVFESIGYRISTYDVLHVLRILWNFSDSLKMKEVQGFSSNDNKYWTAQPEFEERVTKLISNSLEPTHKHFIIQTVKKTIQEKIEIGKETKQVFPELSDIYDGLGKRSKSYFFERSTELEI